MIQEYKAPWHPIHSSGKSLKDELKKELCSKHVLFDIDVIPLAQRRDCDEVLLELIGSDHKYAIVHLTWLMREEENPSFPQTELINDDTALKTILDAQVKEWDHSA